MRLSLMIEMQYSKEMKKISTERILFFFFQWTFRRSIDSNNWFLGASFRCFNSYMWISDLSTGSLIL